MSIAQVDPEKLKRPEDCACEEWEGCPTCREEEYVFCRICDRWCYCLSREPYWETEDRDVGLCEECYRRQQFSGDLPV